MTQQIIDQVKEGEKRHIDAFIELRKKRHSLEQEIELIKEWESDNIDKISFEASEYDKNIYNGFEIKSVNGRKTYSFKGIPEWESIETNKKKIEEKYKSAFDGIEKGTVVITDLSDEQKGWVSPNGEILPFPDVNISKGYLTIKQK